MTDDLATSVIPLCGDPTCECPGCQPQAIEDWYRHQTADAKALVRPWTVCDPCKDHRHNDCTMVPVKGLCCCDD